MRDAVLVRALAGRARSPSHQRGPPRAALGRARRASAHARRHHGHVVRGLGARSPRRQRGGRLQRLERARTSDALARCRRRLGAVRARGGRGPRLQVRDPRRRRRRPPQGRPRRPAGRAAAEDRLGGLRAASPLGRRELAGEPAVGRAARGADLDLRGAPRLLAAQHARGQPLADVHASRPTSSRTTRSSSASRTSSCCP